MKKGGVWGEMKGGRGEKRAKRNWPSYLTFAYGDLGEMGWVVVAVERQGRFPG